MLRRFKMGRLIQCCECKKYFNEEDYLMLTGKKFCSKECLMARYDFLDEQYLLDIAEREKKFEENLKARKRKFFIFMSIFYTVFFVSFIGQQKYFSAIFILGVYAFMFQLHFKDNL